MCCWGIKLLCQTQFSFFQRECGPAWSSSWFNNSHYRHHHISGFFPPELCHLLSTLMGDYEHKFHCITWFNWSSWLIMSAALGETKFWTWHFRFSTQKLPVIMGTWNYLWTRGISKWQSSGKNSSRTTIGSLSPRLSRSSPSPSWPLASLPITDNCLTCW